MLFRHKYIKRLFWVLCCFTRVYYAGNQFNSLILRLNSMIYSTDKTLAELYLNGWES